VSHPGIVKLDYTLESDRAYTLALEYCPGGDLFNLIQNKGKLNEEEARFYSGQIVNVIAHLHSKGIIYRDLKPENLLIDRNGNMKLADFGLAIQTRVDQREQRYGQVGTTEFFAPEIAANREYGTSVDWWSFGCVLYQMLTGAFPFFGENKYKLIDNILKKEPEYPAEFSAELVDLFKQLFEKDPTKRISTAGLKQHSWFAGLDWSALDNQTLQAPCIPNLTCDSDVENFDKEFTSLPIEDPFVVSGQISPLSVATRRDEDPNATFKSVSMILPPPVEIIQC
jgi:serine/threonine protein kinase